MQTSRAQLDRLVDPTNGSMKTAEPARWVNEAPRPEARGGRASLRLPS